MGRNSLFLFGEFLVNEGVIGRDQLAEALMEQIHGNFSDNQINVDTSTRKRIGEVMVHLGFLTVAELESHIERYNSIVYQDV
jgi:hypothetical protein